METSGINWGNFLKFWENNINEILDKFWMKFLGNIDWIILNKIFIEFNLWNI